MENNSHIPEETGPSFFSNSYPISGNTLKILANLFMLIDHVAAVVLKRIYLARYNEVMASGDTLARANWFSENETLFYTIQIMRNLGRISFPIFAFLLVEGFQKTSNRSNYAKRLGLFCLISEIPFDLAFSGSFFALKRQNVFFTLLIGFLCIWSFHIIREKTFPKIVRLLGNITGLLALPAFLTYKLKYSPLDAIKKLEIPFTDFSYLWIFLIMVLLMTVPILLRKKTEYMPDENFYLYMSVLPVFMMLASVMKTDYGAYGVLAIVLMYTFRRNKMISYAAGTAILSAMASIEAYAFLGLIPISQYTGKCGRNRKYLFYPLYPLHFIFLWLIAYFMGYGWMSTI